MMGSLFEGKPFKTVMADTSYSDMSTIDNRGAAASEVQLLRGGAARIHGVLPDGRTLDYALMGSVSGLAPSLCGRTWAPDDLVGRPVPTPSPYGEAQFVKTRLVADGGGPGAYLLCHVSGFVTTYEELLDYLQAKAPGCRRTHLPIVGRNVVLYWSPWEVEEGGDDETATLCAPCEPECDG